MVKNFFRIEVKVSSFASVFLQNTPFISRACRDQGPDKSCNSQLLEVVRAFRDFACQAQSFHRFTNCVHSHQLDVGINFG